MRIGEAAVTWWSPCGWGDVPYIRAIQAETPMKAEQVLIAQ